MKMKNREEEFTKSESKKPKHLRKYRILLFGLVLILILVLWIVRNYGWNLITDNNPTNEILYAPNFDRIEAGVYRLRVEVFRDRENDRRADTFVDFDRDLSIIISENNNGLVSLNVQNLRDDIIVDGIRIRGDLRNRSRGGFHVVDMNNVGMALGYREVSNGVPITAYGTDDDFNLMPGNWRWVDDVEEMSTYFQLEVLDIRLYFLEDWTEGNGIETERNQADDLILIRYVGASDSYHVEEGRDHLRSLLVGYEADEKDEDEDVGEEDEDDHENDETEPEHDPEPADYTNVELDSHNYTTQAFNVTTELEEIVLRIEHSGENWIGSPFYNVYDDVFEETLDVDADGVIELTVSAIHFMDAMFINDVEVEFELGPYGYGFQQFNFNVEFE